MASLTDRTRPAVGLRSEVRYSSTPLFRVTYHQRKHLWKVAFALERRHENELRVAQQQTKATEVDLSNGVDRGDLGTLLDDTDREEAAGSAEVRAPDADPDAPSSDALDQMMRQAKLIVTGDQFSKASLPYLIDALRLACDVKTRWNQDITDADAKRVARVRRIFQLSTDPSGEGDTRQRSSKARPVLQLPKENRIYERRQDGDANAFMAELREHAAGFLAPLIAQIEVGWPSEVLQSGVELVDLPGVGIAQDAYRDITKRYVREKARAIILVVDRAGPTESTLDLLRSSGYWDRLVGAADDPNSDPCTMLIAVTRVDDVAWTAWQGWDPAQGPRPKKREVFAQTVSEFKPRMRAQITEQLGKIGESSNATVQAARDQARASILEGLEIHPVSAPEYAKILKVDEEDAPVLKDVGDTGVIELQQSLVRLGESERSRRAEQLQEVSKRLGNTLLSELQIIDAQWRSEGRAAEEAQRLEEALQKILQPKREEYDRRVGAFREFLDSTVQAKIEALVLEARAAAELEVQSYLYSLQHAHWATLRAAVRRGGTFYGSRAINLPDDISNYFQEPMAAVWGQKLLRDVAQANQQSLLGHRADRGGDLRLGQRTWGCLGQPEATADAAGTRGGHGRADEAGRQGSRGRTAQHREGQDVGGYPGAGRRSLQTIRSGGQRHRAGREVPRAGLVQEAGRHRNSGGPEARHRNLADELHCGARRDSDRLPPGRRPHPDDGRPHR